MSGLQRLDAISLRLTTGAVLAACFLSACGQKNEEAGKEPAPEPIVRGHLALRDSYVNPPPVRTFPSSPTVIQGWIDAVDTAAIRQHAWDIWESITTMAPGDSLPVWETWYSGQDVYDPESATAFKGMRAQRGFERPAQFHHAALNLIGAKIPMNSNEQITSFNRYTRSLAEAVWNKGYNNALVLDSINSAFNTSNTPIAERTISTSKDSVDAMQMALKPVFQFIDGTQPTVLPFWAGRSTVATSNPDNPTVETWKQGVVIDPTGKMKVGSVVMRSVNGGPPVPCRVVSLDDFYHFTLTAEEASAFSDFAKTSGDDIGEGNKTDSNSVAAMVKAGNIALLVAMHVTGKEITNWTWQTFYWSFDPQDPLYGKDRPATIKAPWNHYNLHIAYFMVTPPGASNGTPYVSYNPYLETDLAGSYVYSGDTINWTGVTSNCMSCHRMATWGPGGTTAPYVPSGEISPADSQFFAGLTKIDFLWSITRAQTPEAGQTHRPKRSDL